MHRGKADTTVMLVPPRINLETPNLRHLANEWSEQRVNSVNLREGYPLLSIRTPEEVLRYED